MKISAVLYSALLLPGLSLSNQDQDFPTKGCLTASGWLEYNDHCCKLTEVTSPKSQDKIADDCRTEGPFQITYLPDVQTDAENDFTAEVVAGGQRAWIGAKRDYFVPDDPFFWATEESTVYRSFLSGTGYTNWKRNEPNNKGFDEGCVEINRGPPGRWNDLTCRRKRLGVCIYSIATLEKLAALAP